MTRPTTHRLRVRGWLQALAPLHVGGAGGDPNGALTVAVDGQGRPYVPGTSLAGALRTLLHPASGSDGGPHGERANSLWGYVKSGTQEGTVSRFTVHDGLLATTTDLTDDARAAAPLPTSRLEQRHSVGIDRHTGTAAPGILHSRAVVPQGTFLRLELDLGTTAAQLANDRATVRRLLALLRDGRLRIGAARTRGLGRLTLVEGRTDVYEQDLSTPAGLLQALTTPVGGSLWPRTDWTEEKAPADGLLRVRVDWSPSAPVMVRSGTDGFTVDAVPLATATAPDRVALALPGSALKGALRSHAERIERTARALDAPTAPPGAGIPDQAAAFRHQLDQLPAIGLLFGTAPDAGPGGLGALTVDDCTTEQTIPATEWQQVYDPPAQDGSTAHLAALRPYGLERADHVAIDRWTGGAADGRLYSVLEPHGLTWQPLTLTVDLDRLALRDADWQDAAQALLLFLLRDLAAGRVPLGYATNRGLGDITVHRITLTSPTEPDPVDLTVFLTGSRAKDLTHAWRAYLDGTLR
ncbi:RAMP superfamily CRISPR-associated protein [Streptomyces sp. NPDC058746]|uniref:RAMP superfamily CRISPR-associated protein n=1 Tax=Streptomyces sp. NPDC058746 TaxID=3346622 RepID=UPI00369E2D19